MFKLFALFALLTISLSASADDYETVATFSSATVVNNSSAYGPYNNDDWSLTCGGNGASMGSNSNQSQTKCKITTNYGTGASTSNIATAAISKKALSNISQITFTHISGKGNTGKIYFAYSTDNSTWNAIPLTTGKQGASTPSANTKMTVQFDEISSAYFAVILDKGNNTKGDFRFDKVTITFDKQLAPTYALTINEHVGGTIAVKNGQKEVQSGDKLAEKTVLTVTATPNAGYSFSEWTSTTSDFADATSTETTFTMPAEDTEIGATFTPNNYTFTIVTDNEGKMSVQVGDNEAVEKANGEKLSVPFNATVSVTPIAATDYAFNGWAAVGLTINNPAANPLKFKMPAGAVTLTAAFISANIEYDINLTPTTDGTIAADKTKAKAGETVTLTATPKQTDADYYVFTSWTVLDVNKNEITVTNNQFTMPASDVKIEATFTRQYKVTFSVNGTPSASTRLEEGASITFPADPADIYGKKFVGWTTSSINGTQSTAPDVLLSEGTMPTEDMTYYAVFATLIPGNEEKVVDELNHNLIGVTETNYNTWDNLTAPSGAIYAGNSAGSYSSIQLRSKDNNSGIVTTTSGGKIKKVVVTWNSNTTSGRTLDIYGSNTAYTEATVLYSQGTQGTKIGSITYSPGSSTELEVRDDYEYIGLRSSSGAMYITSIAITWLVGEPDTYSGYCTTVPMGEKDPVSGKYYATYSSIQAFKVPNDVTVAQVVEKNGLIYLERYAAGDVVAANTGVLLESENIITTAFELTNEKATDLGVENVLKASGAAGIKAADMAADNPGDNYFYRLTKGRLPNGEIVFGFYWKVEDGAAFDLGANKAYMVLPKSDDVQSAPRYVWLDGQTTAIDGLNADTEATVGSDERIYSLDGRRVEGQLKRGIYVKNGKKFIVR